MIKLESVYLGRMISRERLLQVRIVNFFARNNIKWEANTPLKILKMETKCLALALFLLRTKLVRARGLKV